MRRMPNRFHTRDTFSSSTPRPGGTDPGGSSGGLDPFRSRTSFHHKSMSPFSFLSDEESTGSSEVGELTIAKNFFSSGVKNVLRDTILTAMFIQPNGQFGNISVVAYNLDMTEVARSQPKAFSGGEGYVLVNWKHGLPVGANSFYVFNIEFSSSSPITDVRFDYGAFFSFTGGGGTGTVPGGPGGGSGGGGSAPANIREMYLSRYTHGPAEVIVEGTSIQAAIDSMPNSGGVILVKEAGVYDAFSFYNRTFSSWCSVMNYPGHTPQVSGLSHDFQGNERAVVFDTAVNCGVYGFDISSTNASGHPYADGVFVRNSHHITAWANNIHDVVHGVGAADDGGGGCNHVDACYNQIHDCSGWLDTMASAISYFKLANIGGGDGPDGYSSHLIGNIIWNAVNDASYGGAITDGNGIIIDIANGDYSSAPIGYTGHTLVAFNLCVSNGGRGVHAFFSRWVHQYFNTVALNLRSSTMTNDGEIQQYGNHDGAESKYNLVMTATNRTNWIADGDSTVDTQYNVIVRGSNPVISGTNVDRTGVGPSYFTNPSTTDVTAANWKPVTPDNFTVESDVLAALSGWPDAAGNTRPSNGIWSAGAVSAVYVAPNPTPGLKSTTLPPGSYLMTDAEAAARVRPTPENRPDNYVANHTRGNKYPNSTDPFGAYYHNRVTGDFVGTTDEIIQWASWKWGFDEDWIRAQAVQESTWHQDVNGDAGESWGIHQVRLPYWGFFFNDPPGSGGDSISSTAYSLDAALAARRACFEGTDTWLMDVEHEGTYVAGDLLGAMGVWLAGRWYTPPAREYIASVQTHYRDRTWEQDWFQNG